MHLPSTVSDWLCRETRINQIRHSDRSSTASHFPTQFHSSTKSYKYNLIDYIAPSTNWTAANLNCSCASEGRGEGG